MELGQTIEKDLLINFLFLMADGYRVLGNAQKQRDLFERASPLLERYYGPHHPKVALNLMSLSAAYVALGDAKKARDLLERALPILENHYGSDHPEAARTLTNMGVSHVASDHTEKAHELLERALTIGERYYGPNHPKVTKTLQALHRLKILEHTQETVPQSSAQQPHRLMEELFNAARQGDLQKIRDCISKGAKVNAQNAGYKTALHIAAEKGYVNIIRTLLEKGANSGVREIIGWTPLHMAAANGHLEVVNALLENNADPTIKDKEEKTPLNLAEERKNKVELPGILEEVKNYQEIINSLSKRVNELEQVQKDLFNFLKKSSSELTTLQKKKAYQIARIESYLKKGARINTIDSNHRTVLHFAAKNGRLEVVNVILENGADPTIKDKEEKTPLDLVVEQKNKVEQSGMLEEVKNYQEIIDVLSEKINKLEKSKLKSQDELFNAVKQGDLQKVRDCLRKGTNVNAKNTAHETPLHIAAEKSYKDIVQTLLENGANIEEQDIIAWTPLHLAAANGHLEIVNTLLKRITDRYQFIKLNAGDNKVASPLQLAAQKHHLQIVNVLLTKGASLGVVPRVDNDALLRLREWRTKFSKKMSKCRTPYS
jgi:ankyrin repeat protein